MEHKKNLVRDINYKQQGTVQNHNSDTQNNII